MQDEAADDDDSVVSTHPSQESKLANFTWASKLSNASSTSVQPGLLQSLTGTIAGIPDITLYPYLQALWRILCILPYKTCRQGLH